MADLGDRGQILLIAAFALAVTFVSLALVVNSAIFTENLASRGETGGSDAALALRHQVESSVGESMRYANVHNTSTASGLREAVEDGAENATRAIDRQQARTGAFANVTWDPDDASRRTMGSRIAQNDSAQRPFTSAEGTPSADWTVVEDVASDTAHTNGTRAFRINASTMPSGGDPFVVRVNETGTAATNVWTMELWEDAGGDVRVDVEKPNGDTASCAVASRGASVSVHVTRGLVEGAPCDALRWSRDTGGSFENYRFAAGVSTSYNVTFRNGDQIAGNYSLVTTNASIGNSGVLEHGAGSSSPYATDAVYSVLVEYRYDTATLHYVTQIRVAPGENP